jgi:hypothetical protein
VYIFLPEYEIYVEFSIGDGSQICVTKMFPK